MRSSVFPPLSLWEKRGSGHDGIPLNTEKGRVVVELVVGCIFFLSPAFPLTPHCLTALKSTPSLSQEVLVKCVCVGKCWEGAFIETEQSGTFRIVFPPAPHPLAASLAVSLLLSPRTKNALNAWRLLQCQITKG